MLEGHGKCLAVQRGGLHINCSLGFVGGMMNDARDMFKSCILLFV